MKSNATCTNRSEHKRVETVDSSERTGPARWGTSGPGPLLFLGAAWVWRRWVKPRWWFRPPSTHREDATACTQPQVNSWVLIVPSLLFRTSVNSIAPTLALLIFITFAASTAFFFPVPLCRCLGRFYFSISIRCNANKKSNKRSWDSNRFKESGFDRDWISTKCKSPRKYVNARTIKGVGMTCSRFYYFSNYIRKI